MISPDKLRRERAESLAHDAGEPALCTLCGTYSLRVTLRDNGEQVVHDCAAGRLTARREGERLIWTFVPRRQEFRMPPRLPPPLN